MKTFAPIALLLFVTACSSTPSLTGPSPAAVGTTALVGDARNSCSSAAPGRFRVTSGERVNEVWKNQVSWEPVASSNAPGYLTTYSIEIYRRPVASRPFATHTLTAVLQGDGLASVDLRSLPDGIYSARLQAYCFATAMGVWSQTVTFTNGESALPDVHPAPIPEPEPEPEEASKDIS